MVATGAMVQAVYFVPSGRDHTRHDCHLSSSINAQGFDEASGFSCATIKLRSELRLLGDAFLMERLKAATVGASRTSHSVDRPSGRYCGGNTGTNARFLG